MAKDKYSAVWVSHSSITDYLKCPRLYYLRNVYRNPETNRKIALMQPALALGQIVHDTIESLSRLKAEERFIIPLSQTFIEKWNSISGKKGGFENNDQENTYKNKGLVMIENVMKHPGPLANKAIKIRQELPYYWLSEEENIILCGKIDWLEYIEATDSVHIIDFKTGKYDEDPDSLQLPIYSLIVKHCQNRPITRASYWYLERDSEPFEMEIPDESIAYKNVLEIAKKIALARKLEHFKCKSKDGCRFCRSYEAILAGKSELVGINDYGQEVHVIEKTLPH